MSPLQFQKRMRLMLTERMEASSAAYEVGYDSPSQFSREYSRQFGAPPMRDIRNLVQPSANRHSKRETWPLSVTNYEYLITPA